MAPSSTRRMSWRVVTPVIAIAALGLTACSNNEQVSDVPGTTPPVWTGAADPGAHGSEGHEAEGGHGAPAATGAEHSAPTGGALTTNLTNAAGAQVGTATFTETDGHVEVSVSVTGQQPGFHGLHVHSVGKCEPSSVAPTGGEPGVFLSAGSHLQVAGKTGHPSSGDLTSLLVLADGTGKLVTTTDAFTLDDLRNAGNGTSVVVHEKADNFGNIPTRYEAAPDQETLNTGDAGSRVACGVIGGH